MADYVANCPISRPRSMQWKMTWDIGGMAWSHDWGMFYDVPSTEDQLMLRKPINPSGM